MIKVLIMSGMYYAHFAVEFLYLFETIGPCIYFKWHYARCYLAFGFVGLRLEK